MREIFFADRVKEEVDNAVAAVEVRVQDKILTAMDSVAVTKVEMAVMSITGSSGNGLNRVVENLDQRVFSAKAEDTPLMTASSRTGLKY